MVLTHIRYSCLGSDEYKGDLRRASAKTIPNYNKDDPSPIEAYNQPATPPICRMKIISHEVIPLVDR